MTATILIHHRTADTFARIPHDLLSDDRISWNAKGILCYLLGKPPGWKARVTDIKNRGKDGARAIRSGLNELRATGYVRLIAIREGGRIKEWQWQVADFPMFSPDARNELLENEDLQNVHHSKKEGSKKDSSKKESKEPKGTAFSAKDAVDGVFDSLPEIDPKWKPSQKRKLSKDKILARINPPSDYPSEDEFNQFLEDEGCDQILSCRDLYSDLCVRKWHHWKPETHRWNPIRDWRSYVVALEKVIAEAGSRR